MNNHEFEVIAENILDTSEAPKGKDIYYKCMSCGDIIPSQPKDNVGCKCGNIFIDVDYFRLAIQRYSKFQALRKIRA
jgi:hypothetical protein